MIDQRAAKKWSVQGTVKKWCVRWFSDDFAQGGAAFDTKKEAEAYVVEQRKRKGMYLVTEPKLEEFVDPFDTSRKKR